MSAPKQGIQLKQSQTLTVTPQMQQSLKILQYNQQELEIEITKMLDENIMLESLDNSESLYDNFDEYQGEHLNNNEENINNTIDNIPDEIDSDIDWKDLYDDDYSQASTDTENIGFQDNWVSDQQSFDEQLEQNIHLSQLNKKEKKIACDILMHLNEHYFLTLSHKKLATKLKIDKDTLLQVLNVIKHFDPPGVASLDSRECLLAQLHTLDKFTDAVGDAHDILTDYYTYLGQKDTLILKRLGLSQESFDKAMQLIRYLSPYPRVSDTSTGNIIKPDIFVRQRMGVFYASPNQDIRYDVGLNESYIAMTKHCKADEKRFISAQLQNAKFFLRSLDQRRKTILLVTNAIVMHQQDFFIKGQKALQPLSMKNIAKLLDMAESTISRAVNGKYLSFNQQLIELRTFFSNDLSHNSSGEIDNEVVTSASAIKALIKELIDEEPAKTPFSDSSLEKILHGKGINIARRTITKYRKAMGILPTSKRKRRN
ncbi:MAG: RNA polymerase factor sigma-54 [Ostreibacterium sp.]